MLSRQSGKGTSQQKQAPDLDTHAANCNLFGKIIEKTCQRALIFGRYAVKVLAVVKIELLERTFTVFTMLCIRNGEGVRFLHVRQTRVHVSVRRGAEQTLVRGDAGRCGELMRW